MTYPVKLARFSKEVLLGGLWVGVIVSLGFLIFRLYVRLRVSRRLRVDDAFVIAAWLMNLANAILWQVLASDLYTSIAVASGQMLVPPTDFFSRIDLFIHSELAWLFLFTTGLWAIKVSFLLFFRGLGNKIRRQRIIWWYALGFTAASYPVCLGLYDYRCLARPDGGSLAECFSNRSASYEYVTTRCNIALDIITDAFIVLVSTNILWKVQISLRKKLAFAGIFSLTLFTVCIAIIRISVALNGPRLDLTWIMFWAAIEHSVAIVIACLASFRTLYSHTDRRPRHSPVNARAFQWEQSGSSSQRVLFKNRGHFINVDEDSHVSHDLRPITSSEDAIPLDSVHIRQDFSVTSGPNALNCG